LSAMCPVTLPAAGGGFLTAGLANERDELVVEVPMLLMMMKAGIGGFGDKTKEDAAFDPKSKTENDIRGK
jgi:hypothetical protein